MNKYRVTLIFDATNSIEVNAASIDEALDKAYNSEKSRVTLCHQCAKEIDIADITRVIVYDDKGNEVFDDGYQDTQIAKLTEQVDALAAQNVTLRESLVRLYEWAYNWDSEFMNDPEWIQTDRQKIKDAATLPNISADILRQRDARTLDTAATRIAKMNGEGK